MSERAERQSRRKGAVPRGPAASRSRVSEFSLRHLPLQDVHEIRLLLRGDSIIDWHRLLLHDREDVRRLFAVNTFDISDAADLRRLEALRRQAVQYIRETLQLKLEDDIARHQAVTELPLLASGRGHLQRQACTLLKVMHIIYHLDARELRMALPIPDSDLYSTVEESVVRMFDELRAAGVPVVEFSWSRKSKESLITKLLVKRETYAAQVFDRLRFRLIVENERDLYPTLHVMLHRFIPFNYVVPGQTVNSLVDTAQIERRLGRSRDVSTVPPAPTSGRLSNEFSSRDYRVLNFVADLPVRIDPKDASASGQGHVVFVLAEFQIMDRNRAIANEQGENSHDEYKRRQHHRVRERLLREPRKPSSR